jgi:hypothetical protein
MMMITMMFVDSGDDRDERNGKKIRLKKNWQFWFSVSSSKQIKWSNVKINAKPVIEGGDIQPTDSGSKSASLGQKKNRWMVYIYIKYNLYTTSICFLFDPQKPIDFYCQLVVYLLFLSQVLPLF